MLTLRRFTAPLTPTIKKYLEISQTKSSVAKTLFPSAPAARAKHPLSQTTTAASDQTVPPAVSRHVSASVATSRDRNLQAIRGLGRSISTNNASAKPGPSSANGIRPFLLRSASAAVPTSTVPRAGTVRSVSVANVFGNGQLEEEEGEDGEAEDGSTEDTSSAVSATRPRVITHASAPDLASSSAIRTGQAQRAAGTGAVRRARVVSGLTQVTEGRSTTGLGMGRPQGAVRPNAGRVVSSSATIGVGARGTGMVPVKPRMGVEARKAVAPPSDPTKPSEGQDAKPKSTSADVGGRVGGGKVITTNPGGTTKTRQFFRPTSTSSASTSTALDASTQSNTSAGHTRPIAEPRRIVSRTAGARTGGLTAPTASSGAKVVHRVPVDALVPQTTGSSAGTTTAQAKPIVSPRKPRQKLKPPIPAFMPTSRVHPPSNSHGTATARPKVRSGSIVAAVEPASVPLPESPAPRRVTARIVEDERDDPFAAAMSMAVAPGVKEISEAPAVSALPLTENDADTKTEEVHEQDREIPVGESNKDNEDQSAPVPDDVEPVSLVEDLTLAQGDTAVKTATEHAVHVAEESVVEEGDASAESVTFKQRDGEGLRESLARASTSRAIESATPIEGNLIDLDGPEPEVARPVHVAPSPAKRTPLGPASPNQMIARKIATPKTKSPKIKQLSEFFENKAFSPSPSPEQTAQLSASGRRSSTTPVSTPPRPRVLS